VPTANEPSYKHPSISKTILHWYRDESRLSGSWRSAVRVVALLWQFLRDSTPSRRRQRYGDVDFDWDYRVDTTGATVGWRDRLLGLFNSPYQPTDPVLFRGMLDALQIDFEDFTFIDIGSGKGRVLLMAAEYPFRRILGVELFASLHQIAQENIARFHSDSQKCFAIESVCEDARDFAFPNEPLLVYLFNPLPEAGLRQLLENLERSLRQNPRPATLLYSNPLLEHVLSTNPTFRKTSGTHQYSVFKHKGLQ
jgi:SAM-dependent methyltransferase